MGPQLASPLGFEAIADLSTAVGLTVPSGADFAVIRATGAVVYWRDDGVAPTSSAGMPLGVTDPPLEYFGDLSAIRFVSASGGVSVSFYRIAG